MNWPLLVLSLLSIGAPSVILILDRAKEIPFQRTFRIIGIPALIIFIAIVIYSGLASDPILSIITWGLVGGLLCTVALDAVRLTGVKLRAFPLDMPIMFGLISSGLAPKLPKNVMAKMVEMLADLPDNMRKEMMDPRIKAFAKLSPPERRLFVSMLFNGLNRLAPEKRERVMKTQIEILSSLAPEDRSNMMKTMDEFIFGVQTDSNPGVVASSPMPIFREGKVPKLPMQIARQLLRKAIPATCKEAGVSFGRVRFAGYLWHFINGATYGLAYTLLFGMGSWPLALAWGIFVDLVMMVSMPPMMPMIRLPFPRFLVVPYLAHLAMAIPIGYFALTYITPQATLAASLFGELLLAGDTFLTLTLAPLIAIIVLTGIIFLGYKAYTKPIYGKD